LFYSYDALLVRLENKTVIAKMKSCLQRISLLSTFRHGSPSDKSENVNTRFFLAAYMIAFRPNHVFESFGDLEKTLYESAQATIAKFESICNAIVVKGSFRDIDKEISSDFPNLLYTYLVNFQKWKTPDQVYPLSLFHNISNNSFVVF
jgi:hypothetical protein